MTTDKCRNCRWYVVMAYRPIELMCHYNWKYCEEVKQEECHFKKKKERVTEMGREQK